MRKGRPIFLEGHLQLDQWTSQDGQRRSKLRVVLERFQFISPREAPPEPVSPEPGPPADEGSFDDVPF